MSLVRSRQTIHIDSPVLIMFLDGWVDAGLGAGAAMAAVLQQTSTDQVATFDVDALTDHRARRPVLRLVDGVIDSLTWPEIELRAGQDRDGNGVLLLTGPEPDMRWQEFSDTIADIARQEDVRLVVGLGAFPAPVPHTRPVRLASTATTAELAEKIGFVAGAIEVPCGINAVIEHACSRAGIPAAGVWARVPHYIAQMPFPGASGALVDGLVALTGLALSSGDLHRAGSLTTTRIDEFVANNPEHLAMVRQLEAQLDATEAPTAPSTIPSGDELAAELYRFLRAEPDGSATDLDGGDDEDEDVPADDDN